MWTSEINQDLEDGRKKKQEEVEEGGTWTWKGNSGCGGTGGTGSNERVQIHDRGFGGGGEAYINEYK